MYFFSQCAVVVYLLARIDFRNLQSILNLVYGCVYSFALFLLCVVLRHLVTKTDCFFSVKYSAAAGPPVGPECEHCGGKHQVRSR